ncbi:threonine/homoserine efflux transporter RhtA [Scopulibacillus darangshiensis]|uniref:Threonine/homoserine efflux transporter RhtA n=1 Tax=Scopulibacillus darangshiensis TaxID=442528 RepID=A0A4R2NA74_9BACL|nr:DMT family transporter [Scopulibacillus darangshiensis]TCP17900.1 threonine/homoserine efflux transporter RhtA [Scopulibacillus darangshiensis]
MKKMKYVLLVLFGGCSYGLLSSVIKLGFLDGFSIQELLCGQYLFGWLGLLVIVLLFSRHKVSKRELLTLLIIGTTMSMTGIFYGFAIEELSASIAVVFLFQFTWMGVVIEAMVNKTFPGFDKMISIVILFIGTLLAGGLFEGAAQDFSLRGILFGLLAAVSFSLFVFVSGHVGTTVPAYTKSFLMTTGATMMVCIFSPPTFLINGALQAGLWKYALFLGLFGVVIPIICFSIGTPKVGAGLGTILGAVELPTAIIASITLVNEAVSIMQWIGIILILLGIVIPQYLKLRKEKQKRRRFVA